ncbi:MAG: YndJ family transporter [Bacteroidota bacterium]
MVREKHALPIALVLLAGLIAGMGFGNFQLNVVVPFYIPLVLLAGPLLIVPSAWLIMEKSLSSTALNRLELSALLFGGICLAIAFFLPNGWWAGSISAIYLLLTTRFSWRLWYRGIWPFFFKVAFSCLPVAAAWAVADRLGWQPLGFDALIVLLTAIHFHYAGFALAILAGLLPVIKYQKWVHILYVGGVGGVAVGITVTQFSGPVAVEILATTIMACFGIYVAMRQLNYAWRQNNLASKVLLLLGSLALLVGMILALAYGWRWTHHWPWLTIPFMYATHGLLNSLGFASLSLLGYSLSSNFQLSLEGDLSEDLSTIKYNQKNF